MTDNEFVTQLHSAQQAGMLCIIMPISQPGQDSHLQPRVGVSQSKTRLSNLA